MNQTLNYSVLLHKIEADGTSRSLHLKSDDEAMVLEQFDQWHDSLINAQSLKGFSMVMLFVNEKSSKVIKEAHSNKEKVLEFMRREVVASVLPKGKGERQGKLGGFLGGGN